VDNKSAHTRLDVGKRPTAKGARGKSATRQEARTEAKVILWDIESSNLNANFGYILCIGWKELDKPGVTVKSITDYPLFKTDPTNDKQLLADVSRDLSAADCWVSWYGSRFDVPYVQSRLILHRLPIMPPVQHVDAWRIAKYKMKLNSNRLASVSAFLELEEKTPLSGPIWIRAAAGHRESVRYVQEHCKQDVLVLEQAYKRIRPLSTNHPALGVVSGQRHSCPNCGSVEVQRRGFAYTRLGKYYRFQCTTCGAWSRDGKALERVDMR